MIISVLVLGGLLVGHRIALALTVASVLSLWIAYSLEISFQLPAQIIEISPSGSLIISAISLLFVVLLQVLSFRIKNMAEKETKSLNRVYRALFEKTLDAVLVFDGNLRLLRANSKSLNLLEYSLDELAGFSITRLFPKEKRNEITTLLEEAKDGNPVQIFETLVVCKEFNFKTVEAMLTFDQGSDEDNGFFQLVLRDITERKHMERMLEESFEEMEKLATKDSLTGIHNRRTILAYGNSEIARARREKKPLCFMLIDIDNLKQINDVHSYLAGDAAINFMAENILASKRLYDWVGRWGGDEFLLVLPRANLMEGQKIGERILEQISNSPPIVFRTEKISVQTSIGLACHPARKNAEMSFEDLFMDADLALKKAKQGGRNRIEVHRNR